MRGRRLLAGGAVGLVLAAVLYVELGRTLQPAWADVEVRWAPRTDAIAKQAAERRYRLFEGREREGRTWSYLLTDTSRENVRALVGDPAVENTANIDRATFRVDRHSTRGRAPRSLRRQRTIVLRVAVILAGLLGIAAVSLGLAGTFAPDMTAALFAARPAPYVAVSGMQWALLFLVLAASVALEVTSMQRMTQTVDEPAHLRYGRGILALDSTRFDDSKMPISALNAIPGAIAERMAPGVLSAYLAHTSTARYATVVFSLLTGLCVFAWARRLYGPRGGLLATTLYAFDPNLLAHAQLTTTDIYAAGTMVIALYLFWRFLREGSWTLAVASALALGLTQIAKYTAIVLFPLFLLAALLFHVPALRQAWREGRFRDLWRGSMVAGAVTVAFVAVSLLVVNIGFLFNRTLTPFDQYTFYSNAFRSLQSAAGVVGEAPVPTPYPYLEGLDLVMEHERTGSSFGLPYLFGRLNAAGFSGYYFWASLYKVPLGIQALLIAAAVSYVIRRRYRTSLRDEVLLLVPVVFFAIYFNFFYRAQIGIRYFLIIFPLVYILAGSLVAGQATLSRWARVGLITALASIVASVLSYYPHFLAYFNELIPDRTQTYRILADSNLDWGQYGYYLDDYRAREPGSVFEPDKPVAGTILVRANMLVGVVGDANRFRWLREHFRPVGHIAHGILVYRVTPAELAALESRR
ncbi:MAG TPA: glycosyltransferase family 39 protein [Vicinamibacterales bacterium]|nr:glycosyltransferase family 39 protein [Vicinamibacterales bacterium]